MHLTPWQQNFTASLLDCPAAARPWIAHKASMTKKMQSVNENVTIHVLKQVYGYTNLAESTFLDLKGNQRALIREVLIECDQRSWMYARTVVPQGSLAGPLRRIKSLGSQPLGYLLFNQNNMHRSAFEFAKLRSGDIEYERANQMRDWQADVLWARRSCFCIQEQPLLLMEVFLPEMLQDIEGK